MMRFPKFLENTPYKAEFFSNGVSKTGGNEIVAWASGKCVFIEKNQTLIDSESKKVISSAYLIIKGDIASELSKISNGAVVVNDQKYNIVACDRIRNSNGTVFSTEVYLR